jgi:uncharacterized surface protein with fasciclin (FAS1) repeats
MTRYHSKEDVQRFDLMKLGVLLLLLALLVLTWLATRDAVSDVIAEATPGSPAAETGEAYPGAEDSNAIASLPAPTLVPPAIDLPDGPVPAGSVSLSGTAGPGAQVIILVNGSPAGTATAGVDGRWSATLELPDGNYEVQAQVVDNVGTIISQTDPVQLAVGSGGEANAPELAMPEYDPVSGDYTFSGLANPGDNVAVISNGTTLGTATADEAGNWSILVPATVATGELRLQIKDATGNVTFESGPIALEATPDASSPEATPAATPEAEATNPATTEPTAETTSEPVATSEPAATGEPEATSEPTTPATEEQTIVAVLQGQPDFSAFWEAVQSSGIDETLAGPGLFTVFAPTNEAFDRLPPRVIEGLYANPEVLQQLIQYHITRGRYLETDLIVVQPATLNDRLVTIVHQGGQMMVNDALVTSADNVVDNGVIHAIDRILVPPLAVGVRPPIIDESGVPTFVGPSLTIVGTAEPNRTILVELNGEAFGQPATVGPDGAWSVSGTVDPGEYEIVAYMLGEADALEGIARPVTLLVQ